MSILPDTIDSGYISAATTLVVGLIAYAVYLRQKRDFKRDGASILLIEIENAERQLRIILAAPGSPTTLPSVLTMPNNSWDKYKYLFVKDLDQNEWDAITEFYSRCERYDKAVSYNDSFFADDVMELRKNAHAVIAQIAKDHAYAHEGKSTDEVVSKKDRKTAEKYVNIRANFETIYNNNKYLYSPTKPLNDATDALKSVELSLSLSSAGTKLKRISKSGLIGRLFSALTRN